MDPIKLKITNFYSIAYGEIDFSKFSSALVLGKYEDNSLKSNGAGKSSCLEAICWALFNETRQSKVDDIIRWSANETSVEFEFMFDRCVYKVLRRRSRVSKECAVSLFVKDGSKWINESSATSTETNRKILQLLKLDDKIFLNSVYFKQDDISLFANSSPSNRKEIIKSIMKLDRWDEYQEQAKKQLKGIKDNIDKHLKFIHENSTLATDISTINNSIDSINQDLEKLVGTQKKIQLTLNSFYELRREKNLDTLLAEAEKINAKINELKISGKNNQHTQRELQDKIENNTELSRQYAHKIIELENELADNDKNIAQYKKENYDYAELDQVLLSLKLDAAKLVSDLEHLQNISSMVNLGQCQFCLTTDISDDQLLHIHDNNKKKINALNEQIDLTNKKLEYNNDLYDQRRSYAEQIQALDEENTTINATLEKIRAQKQLIDNELLIATNENTTISATLVSIIDQIKSFKIDAEAIDRKIAEQKANDINTQIKEAEDKNTILKEKISAKNIELGIAIKEKEIADDKMVLINNAADTLAKLGQDKASYEQLVRAFGKDGIQAVFIEGVVDELEHYANETLAYICNEPTVIKLRTQKKTGDAWQETLEIDVIMNGFAQTFESLSGGEKFRISLALRIGLSEVLVKRVGGQIGMLLLDEIDSQLDAHGINNLFENIIRGLEKRFKIIVISHNEKLKNRFEDIIMVNKTSKGSFIQMN